MVNKSTTTPPFGLLVPGTENGNRIIPSNERLLLGVILAVSGNLLISVSMNIQKYSHNRQSLDTSENSYLKSKVWWTGLILMVLGEVGNFSAYGFAPASLVAPLGTSTVIANAVIAVLFLKEKVRHQDILGITLAIVGAFLLINFSTKEDTMLTADDIFLYVKQWPFVIYLAIEMGGFAILVYVQKKYESDDIIVSLLQVAILGSLTVISAKAVSSMMTISFQGIGQLTHPIFYVMLLVMVITAVGQVRFLNRAMKFYDATVVVPTNFVLFTISAILSGIVFYREFYGLQFIEIFMFLFGCLLSFIGVYFITGDRDDIKSDRDGEHGKILTAYPAVFTGCKVYFIQPNLTTGQLLEDLGFIPNEDQVHL